MKLYLKNIGPIDTIDINIDSDLTFIYGENNIGKSYAITILYLFLKNYAFTFLQSRFFYSPSFRLLLDDERILKNIKILFENRNDFDITNDVNQYFSNFLSTVFLSDFRNSLLSSFGDISNLKNKKSNEQLYIGVEFDDFFIHITDKNNKLIARYDGKGKNYSCKVVKQHRYPKTENNQVILYYTKEEQFMEDIQFFFSNIYKKSVFSILSIINNVYYLPASRSGLYRALNAFSQILAELAKKRKFLNEKIVLPSISEQDSDYFSRISEINIKRKNQKFNSIAENIEKNLLNGEVSFNQATKQILFHPSNIDINLELLGTSSMIAEVSPIVLYLRYIINSDENIRRDHVNGGKPILFIEEPEAHLHPGAQTLLMECFVDLIKMGAKLVITSHSNYMFQKLNNLIAEKKIDKSVINGIILKQGNNGSYSETIPMSDLGMEDKNFIEVAEILYYEKMKIIEKMEADDVKTN